MRISYFLSLSALALGAIALAACGSGNNGTTAHDHDTIGADGVRSITITGNDAMQFNLNEIRGEPGERVRLTLRHIGRMTKQNMGHNWVLLQSMDASALNSLGMEAAANAPDYLPRDMSVVIAHTRMLGGGESDTIEFNLPEEPGQYPFVCTFPGHFALMRGNVIVE